MDCELQAASAEQPKPELQCLHWSVVPKPWLPGPGQEHQGGWWPFLPCELPGHAGRYGCGVCALQAHGQGLSAGALRHAFGDAAVPQHRHGQWGLPHHLPVGQQGTFVSTSWPAQLRAQTCPG